MGNGNGERGAERGEMARFPFLDAATAERLLDGERGLHRELEPLERLLSAARAPSRPSELGHEQAAIAAFHAARFAPAAVPEPSRVAVSWRRVLTVKAATLGLIGVLGGVAVAAGVTVAVVNTDDSTTPPTSASGPLNGPARASTTTSSSSAGPSSTPPATASGSASPTPQASPTPTPGASQSTAPIPPNVIGLCQQWRKRYPADPDKAATDPHFAGLIAAAGGVDKVDEFCAMQEAAQDDDAPTSTPATTPAVASSRGNS